MLDITCMIDIDDIRTTVSIKKQTQERLVILCKKNQSFDNLINYLIDSLEQKNVC